MVIIWAVSFVCALVVIFGTTVSVLASIPKRYGLALNYDNVVMIEYMNSTNKKQLFSKDDARHAEPMREIMKRLDQSRKSNKLMDIFRGTPATHTAEYNDIHGIDYNVNFTSTYAKGGLAIWFAKPEYNVTQDEQYNYIIKRGSTGVQLQDVYGIYIPLNKTLNTMQDQTWFLVTTDTSLASTTYIGLPTKVTYLANYSRLWEYVDGLKILL